MTGPEATASAPRRVHYGRVERGLFAVAMTFFIAMILCTLTQILFRYFLKMTLPWTEEAARALFVLSMLLGMAFAYREREHVVVDFLFRALPGPARRWLGAGFAVVILFFLAVWARGAWQLAWLNWNSSLITLPFFRVAYFYLWELGAIVLMALYVLLDLLSLLRGEAEGADT